MPARTFHQPYNYLGPDDVPKAFMIADLAVTTLPHRNPGNVRQWQRFNGKITLTIRPHIDDHGQCRYPYGILPRLILYWIVTEAVLTRSKRINLGQSYAEFVRRVGLSPSNGGGRRGDGTRLKDQLDRLLKAQITVEDTSYRDRGDLRLSNIVVAESIETHWFEFAHTPSTRPESTLILSDTFFNAAMTRAFPVNNEHMHGIRRNVMALDIYAWSSFRVYKLTRRQFISWKQLRPQFGCDYADTKDFKRAFLKGLEIVKLVYPDLTCEPTRGGIALCPCPTAVRKRLVHNRTYPR